MVCGKGGSGKSSVSILMARTLSKEYQVYLIDSDESNALLPKMLGCKPPKPIVEYLGGRNSIFEKGEVNIVNALAEAGKGIVLKDLPERYVSTSPEGIKLIVIGKLEKDEIVLVDTDAGIEHVGRGVEEGTDAILAVVDPTAESLALAKALKDSFEHLNKKFYGVISFDEEIFGSCLEGKALRAGKSLLDMKNLLKSMNLL